MQNGFYLHYVLFQWALRENHSLFLWMSKNMVLWDEVVQIILEMFDSVNTSEIRLDTENVIFNLVQEKPSRHWRI